MRHQKGSRKGDAFASRDIECALCLVAAVRLSSFLPSPCSRPKHDFLLPSNYQDAVLWGCYKLDTGGLLDSSRKNNQGQNSTKQGGPFATVHVRDGAPKEDGSKRAKKAKDDAKKKPANVAQDQPSNRAKKREKEAQRAAAKVRPHCPRIEPNHCMERPNEHPTICM